jgi:hypothetical protein
MMSRLIREEDAIREIDKWLDNVGTAYVGKGLSYYGELLGCISDAPTVDAKPVVHGEWINAYPEIEPNPMFMYGICSECGFEQSISDKLNYCPNCGAKMDGKKV